MAVIETLAKLPDKWSQFSILKSLKFNESYIFRIALVKKFQSIYDLLEFAYDI